MSELNGDAGPQPQVNNHAALAKRKELRFGAFGLVLLVAALVGTSVLYFSPRGNTSYRAHLSEAQSVRTGIDIRIAGITVGKVTGLTLRDDRVDMTFTVKSDVPVGSESTMDVRMLTMIGGHYIALFPAGDAPLGDKAIPADRVTLPYSLMRTMQDAAAPVGAVDGRAIHADITALNSAFSRAPNAYRNIGRMAQSIVGILDKQNRDVSQALKVADEYAGTIDRNRAALGMMVRSLASIERSLLDNRASVTACLQMLAEMLSRAVTLEPASATYLEPVLDKLGESEPALRSLAGKLDSAITTVRSTMRRLVAAAGPDGLSLDQSATTVDGSALCVPIPGRRC